MRFERVALRDIATVIMGLSPKNHDVVKMKAGLPLLNGPTEFGYRSPIPRQWAVKWAKEAETGDVLFCVRGSTTGRINVADQPFAIGRGIAAIRGETESDTRFIKYALMEGLPRLLLLTSGSVFPNLSIADIQGFELTWPDKCERARIAATLGALDDKIESNRRLIDLIPQVIRSFVNLALVEGSESLPVADLAKFINGGAYTKGATGTGRMVLRIAELNSGPGGSTVYNEIEVPDDKTARAGDLLMSWSGSLGVYRWFREEAIINQHIFKVIPVGYPAWFVFDRLDAIMPEFRGIAADKATTMGHIRRVHLESTQVAIPAQTAISLLDDQLSSLWNRLLLAEREVLELAALRDTLLPELLSGRIKVAPQVST